MADMPSDFWSGWIAVITVLSLAGLAWLIFSIYFSTEESAEEESPVWDGSLREGNHPAPMWWFWLIFSSMIVSVIYLMLYPGLGSFSGMIKWSQGGRLNQSMEIYQDQFSAGRESVANATITELQTNSDAMASARRIFSQNCSACHGADAAGQANHFPNLADASWQWGGAAENIEQTIRRGRKAVMVGWEPVLQTDGVEQVMNYVMSLSSGQPEVAESPGKSLYNQFCTACHGVDGRGNPALGASDLTDDVWLYGNSESDVRHSIAIGRSGEMPAYAGRLDTAQIKLLVAWLTRN